MTPPASIRVEVIGLPSPRRFGPGDDLAAAIVTAAVDAGVELQEGDVICVASKVVSLVEGRRVTLPAATANNSELQGEDQVAREDRRTLAREHATEIVADTAEVLVTRTTHGFVAANGGIDASNVGGTDALLLPDDPDASARMIHEGLVQRTGRKVGVIVTDSFGRPWRVGQTEVALGAAGAPMLRDERGGRDLDDRPLTVTEAAVGDEIAAAADLVRTKASGTAFVLVRGLPSGPHGTGRDLIREVAEDLFRFGGATAVEEGIRARRTVRRFVPGSEVPSDVLSRALTAAATAPAPHGSRPWRFLRLSPDTRSSLLDVMANAWREDLSRDGVSEEEIQRRIARSDATLRVAPTLLAPFVTLEEAHIYPDRRREWAERDMFILSAGAALNNLQVVLAAHGFGTAWISSTIFCAPTVRAHLRLPDHFEPVGMIAIGRPAQPPEPRADRSFVGLLLDR